MNHTIGGFVQRLAQAAGTRPLTVLYVVASVLIGVSFQDPIYIATSIIGLGFLALGLALHSMHRELTVVHRLVNSQHDELVARVEQLTTALRDSGQPVPHAPPH